MLSFKKLAFTMSPRLNLVITSPKMNRPPRLPSLQKGHVVVGVLRT